MDGRSSESRIARDRDTRRRLNLFASLILALSLVASAGCLSTGDVSRSLVPREWRGNPWGPEAEIARHAGELPAVPYSPPMRAWEAWARTNLQEGDILFRMGDARAAFGLFPFSRISAQMADSRFSHTGIVAWEHGEPIVYDTTRTGPRRQPFAVWVLDVVGTFGVKRPKPQFQNQIPKAVAYCRRVYQQQVPFDDALTLGEDRLYCIELTELAYRAAGLPLSHPVRIDQLPRYHEFPKVARLVQLFTPIRPDQPAFVIGNDNLGIWSSPSLELVYEAPEATFPRETLPSMIASAGSRESNASR